MVKKGTGGKAVQIFAHNYNQIRFGQELNESLLLPALVLYYISDATSTAECSQIN